jgi:hypothetical protein
MLPDIPIRKRQDTVTFTAITVFSAFNGRELTGLQVHLVNKSETEGTILTKLF